MVTGSKLNNVDNRNSVNHDANRHFRNNKKKYLKAKIDELVINSKIKDIRNFYEKGYKPGTNIV